MKGFLISTLSLALFACHPSQAPSEGAKNTPTSTTEEAAGSSAMIAASPNPVPRGSDVGETKITWNTGSNQPGQVYVSKNGASENLFATGRTGAKKVNWIRVGSRYEFRLYEGTGHNKVLANVLVTHPGKSTP